MKDHTSKQNIIVTIKKMKSFYESINIGKPQECVSCVELIGHRFYDKTTDFPLKVIRVNK